MRRAKKAVHKTLLTVALAGAVALLVGATFQSKPLPTKKELDAALKKLTTDANDPDANTTVGRYYAFVEGEWDKAVPFILHGKDKGMIAMIAEEQKDDGNKYTAVEIGDKWLKAGDSAGALKPYFRDRAIAWYGKGWDAGLKTEPVWGDKLRAKMQLLQALQLKPEWNQAKTAGWTYANVSGVGLKYAKTGRKSAYMSNPNKGETLIRSARVAAPAGKMFEMTAWVLTDGTDAFNDQIVFTAFNNGGQSVYQKIIQFIPDTPYWKKIVIADVFPASAVSFDVAMSSGSTKGGVYIDDVSVKVDDKELIQNGSFEN